MALREKSLNNAEPQSQQQQQQPNNFRSPMIPAQQHPNVVIISVEAAIGTGKSSLLRMLHKRCSPGESTQEGSSSSSSSSSTNGWKWCFVQEPVDMWQDVRKFNSRAAQAAADSAASSPVSSPTRPEQEESGDKQQQQQRDGASTPTNGARGTVSDAEFNLLGKFYNSPADFAFKLQSWAVMSRIETVARTLDNITKEYLDGDTRPVLLVLERSWTSDRNTFAMMHRDNNLMSPIEWVLYDQIYAFAAQSSPTIDGHVYLKCSPDTCMQRLKKRDRVEEASVSAEYQAALIRRHEEWLDGCSDDSVLRLDVDTEFLGDQARADFIFDEICGFASSFFQAKQQAAALAAAPAPPLPEHVRKLQAIQQQQQQQQQQISAEERQQAPMNAP